MELRFSQRALDKHLVNDLDDAIVSGPLPKSVESYKFDGLFSDLTKIPLGKEIIRRGWIPTSLTKGVYKDSDLMPSVISILSHIQRDVYSPALFRGSANFGTYDYYNKLASYLWISKAAAMASSTSIGTFRSSTITHESVMGLVQLSAHEEGPMLARTWLSEHGINFMVLDSLPGMHLDGASLMLKNGNPLIALTLRYDRLDNFWFTLLHELGHVYLHLSQNKIATFLDNFEAPNNGDELEGEANVFALDSFIPRPLWRRSGAYRYRTKKAIIELADRLKIHPAIVAGRLRYEHKDYRDFVDLIGQGEVRKVLIDV